MDASTTRDGMVPFKSPKRFLSELDATVAGRVIASAADIALILDDGVIKDVALGNEELSKEGYESWRGRRWIETVTVESRPKIQDLLNGGSMRGGVRPAQWRQVNHPSSRGVDIPVKYTAVSTGEDGRLVAIGRDLRAVAALQQRLVEAQQDIERDYARLRQSEARYQILFRSITEPVMVVDGASLKIEEANPAASRLFGAAVGNMLGTPLTDYFSAASRRAIETATSTALSTGRADDVAVKLNSGHAAYLLASAFRQDATTRLVVRVASEATGAAAQSGRADFLGVLESLPDGLIVIGRDMRIIAANRAFLDLVHLASEQQAIGAHVVQYLGRSATDLNVLISNVKTNGAVRNFATVLRDRYGDTENVEVSAVAAPHAADTVYGVSVRSVARRLKAGTRAGDELPSSVDQLTGLVGRVSLKEIVRESTDLIEKLCIEAALEITGDNRASAAEMLGLSRQGLYSKLRRFGLGDLD